MDADSEYTGMTIPEYDIMVYRDKQQAEKDRLHDERTAAQRRHNLSMERLKTVAAIVGFIAAACAVVGVSYVIWLGVRGPSEDDLSQERQKVACIENQGTWVALEDGSTDGNQTCLFGGNG